MTIVSFTMSSLAVLLLTEPHLTELLVLHIDCRAANVQRAVVRVVVKLIDELRQIAFVLDFDLEAARPIVADLRLASHAEAGRAVGVVFDVGVLLGAVVPEIDHAIDAAVELDLDLLVALADSGRFELSHALFEIGAAISPEIGCFGLAAHTRHTADGAEHRGNRQPPCCLKSPGHDTPLFWLFAFRHIEAGAFRPRRSPAPPYPCARRLAVFPAGRILALSRVSLGDEQ